MNRVLSMVTVMGLFAALQTEKMSKPETQEGWKPQPGEELLLSAHAKGVQIYACQAGADQKLARVLKGPEAELKDAKGQTVATHTLGPTWKHVDGSEVTGEVVKKHDAPNSDAIPWLLLTAKSHTGKGAFSGVTSIQRIHTVGGLPPGANSCDAGANGKEVRSPYEADYYFYGPASK